VRISFVGEAAHWLLTVADDGRGFDPAEPVSGHYGLLGMRERAHLLGGELQIASAPDAGTRMELELPLGAAESR